MCNVLLEMLVIKYRYEIITVIRKSKLIESQFVDELWFKFYNLKPIIEIVR